MIGPAASIALIVSAFLTAALSGLFGMAGGLVLMGVLAALLPVSAAFVTHGLLQMVANGWRAVLQRDQIIWPIVGCYALASFFAGLAVWALALIPSKPLLYLLLGLVPMLIWFPRPWVQLDAAKPLHALASGFLVTFLNLTAGVAGPLLDIFFVRTVLGRHQIVATKAATQVFSHLAKVTVFGGLAFSATQPGLPPLWVFALAIPFSMLGTFLGGLALDRITDVDFKRWTAWIVTGIGIFYLIKAWQTL